MINQLVLVGRMTRDPELTKAGKHEICRFNLAVRNNKKDEDGKYLTDFFTCVAWNKTAETLVDFVAKGDIIGVTGSINSRKYIDKNTDEEKTIWEVNVASITLGLTPKKDEAPNAAPNKSKSKPVEMEEIDDDNLPF